MLIPHSFLKSGKLRLNKDNGKVFVDFDAVIVILIRHPENHGKENDAVKEKQQ